MTDEASPGRIDWSAGTWTTRPVSVEFLGDDLLVTARAGSDAWRETSYGFVHDDEHALLTELEQDAAVEVAFVLDFDEQFDQAGLFVRVDDETWTKAGVEISDGSASLGAVVTRGMSDWSLSPVDGWSGRIITVRGSRSGNALTIRARVDDEPWRLVRVAPLDPGATVTAGPYCCAPTRSGLRVRFCGWVRTAADDGLHPGEDPGAG